MPSQLQQPSYEPDEQPVELRQLRDKDRQLRNYWGNLRKLHRQLRAKSAQELQELHFKLSNQDNTTTNFDNELAANFANSIELQALRKWLRELANALEKDLASQLRLQEKVRHQLTPAHRNRTETNFDDELPAKFDKKKKSFQSACFPRLSKGQARGELAFKSSLLGSFISEMHFHIRSVDPMNFHIRSLDPMRFHIRSFDNSSLSTKALDSTNFQDDSLTEETFRQATSQPAAWQKRASDRQLLRQQLGRRDRHKGNFSDSNLEEETFTKATSPTAAWKKRPSHRQLQRQQLGRRDLQHSSFKESSLEKGTLP